MVTVNQTPATPGHGTSPVRKANPVQSLAVALAATRPGAGATRLAKMVRANGTTAFEELEDRLPAAERSRISDEAEQLAGEGIYALLMGQQGYPSGLLSMRNAPAALFCLGSMSVLNGAAIGICGSRNASEEGLRAASACGEVAAERNLAVASGYARGVDTAAHISALRSRGRTVVVLPEGITRFRVKRDMGEYWDLERALVVSQFAPTQAWNAGAAMTRNDVITGLSLALLVVEAGDTGGTLAAGMSALDNNRRVIALEFSRVRKGNELLLRRGAIPVRNRAELTRELSYLDKNSAGNQLSIV